GFLPRRREFAPERGLFSHMNEIDHLYIKRQDFFLMPRWICRKPDAHLLPDPHQLEGFRQPRDSVLDDETPWWAAFGRWIERTRRVVPCCQQDLNDIVRSRPVIPLARPQNLINQAADAMYRIGRQSNGILHGGAFLTTSSMLLVMSFVAKDANTH